MNLLRKVQVEVVPTTTTRIVTQTTTPITKIIIMKVPVPETEVTKTVQKQMKDRKISPILKRIKIVKTKLTMTKRIGRLGSQQNQLKKTKLMTLKWLMKPIIQSSNPSRENRVSTDRALI